MIRYWLILLFTCGSLHAQNLVPNGDFEEYTDCQKKRKEPSLPKYWEGYRTPDYYHQDCKRFSNPKNIVGTQSPASGKAYMGLRIDPRDIEYVTVRMVDTLQKGATYVVQMQVSPAEISSYYLKKLYIRLTTEQKHGDAARLLSYPRQLHFDTEPNMDTWMTATDTFVARGGESHLTIKGHIFQSEYLIAGKKRRPQDNLYIYIDDVSLVQIAPPWPAPVSKRDAQKFVLKDVLFDTNESTLKTTAIPTLQNILDAIQEHPGCQLTIIGHTDDVGLDEHNHILSENRAAAVKTYFIEQGIPAHQMTIYGMGSTQPLVPNTSTENRSLNRRVEIELVPADK